MATNLNKLSQFWKEFKGRGVIHVIIMFVKPSLLSR
jgi:hypothetical protein